MALAPLATVADLQQLLGRDLTEAEAAQAPGLLESASESVRDAAGQMFTRTTTTVTLPGTVGGRIVLPQRPVISIDTVTLDGTTATGWRMLAGELWREGGWGHGHPDVTVTYTHGYDEIPRPVVDLVMQLTLVAMKKLADDETLGSEPGIRQESISDTTYAVTYGSDEPAPITVFDLPERTRGWLRRTYGVGDVGTVDVR